MFEKEKKKNRPSNQRAYLRGDVILLIMIIVLGILLVVAYFSSPIIGTDPDYFREKFIDVDGDSARNRIEQFLGTFLPISASNLHFSASPLNQSEQTRFDLRSDDVPAFLDSIGHLCFEMPLQENFMPFGYHENNKTWWRPHSATQFMGSQTCGDNPIWQLMVDQSDDDMWIIYMIAWST